MKKVRLFLLICLCMLFLAVLPADVSAHGPTYITLQPPARSHRGQAYYPGHRQAVSTHTYSYGWFGAQPRSHWRRSNGYSSAYLQWSKR